MNMSDTKNDGKVFQSNPNAQQWFKHFSEVRQWGQRRYLEGIIKTKRLTCKKALILNKKPFICFRGLFQMFTAHQLPIFFLKKSSFAVRNPDYFFQKNKNAKTDISHLACNSIQVPGALGSQSATTGKKITKDLTRENIDWIPLSKSIQAILKSQWILYVLASNRRHINFSTKNHSTLKQS